MDKKEWITPRIIDFSVKTDTGSGIGTGPDTGDSATS